VAGLVAAVVVLLVGGVAALWLVWPVGVSDQQANNPIRPKPEDNRVSPLKLVPPPKNFVPPRDERAPENRLVEFPPALAPMGQDELVRNGDFSQGAKGFHSAYRYTPDSIRLAEGAFNIVKDPRNTHGEAASFRDHSSGNGLMMAVNGNDAVDLVVWGQKVAVKPGSDYVFSFWITSWYPTAPANLEIRVNGKVLGSVGAPSQCGQWKEFKTTWNSGTDKHAIIELFNLTRDRSGNDFAIDDISLRGTAP
jgi:hypothetical protein